MPDPADQAIFQFLGIHALVFIINIIVFVVIVVFFFDFVIVVLIFPIISLCAITVFVVIFFTVFVKFVFLGIHVILPDAGGESASRGQFQPVHHGSGERQFSDAGGDYARGHFLLEPGYATVRLRRHAPGTECGWRQPGRLGGPGPVPGHRCV